MEIGFHRINILEVRRLNTLSVALEVVGPLALVLGEYTVSAQVRRYASDFRVALALDASIDGAYVVLEKPATALTLAAGRYAYDVRLTKGGVTWTFFGGIFEVVDIVTRL